MKVFLVHGTTLELKLNLWPGRKSGPNTIADERKRQLLQESAKVLE